MCIAPFAGFFSTAVCSQYRIASDSRTFVNAVSTSRIARHYLLPHPCRSSLSGSLFVKAISSIEGFN
jgi:hypothetical protein